MADPQYVTLSANAVATITLGVIANQIEVLNVDGAAEVYVTVDGSTPTVGGDGTWCLPATICSIELEPRTSSRTVVKLISAGTPRVSVGALR